MTDEKPKRNTVTVRMALIDNYTQLADLEKIISEVMTPRTSRQDGFNCTGWYIQ